MDADYWHYFDVAQAADVVGFLKTNLTDLAGHYHALYQDEEFAEERTGNFGEAQHWYREYLRSFPAEGESPQINYRLADLLLENEQFADAAEEYERTAYEYPPHEQAAEAGYAAVYGHRQHLARTGEDQLQEVTRVTVASSLRFAERFPAHEQAATVLGAAADDLYSLQEFSPAIDAAQWLIDRYPESETPLLRSAWLVVANSSIDLSLYQQSESAYMQVLNMTAADDESRPAIVDGLAASIYKQGEEAQLAEDYRGAADHFLRVKAVTPDSTIRSAAEYDAAAALIQLEDWAGASGVLEEFRATHTQHELSREATKQLAYVYREAGEIAQSAREHERMAAESEDPEMARDALLTAGSLYDEAGETTEAVRVFESYIAIYPEPLDLAMETRNRLAKIFESQADYDRYYAQLRDIVAADAAAAGNRTDRSRFLAGHAALELATIGYQAFLELRLVQPFEQSLATKQQSMDAVLASLEALVEYQVADVTAAATFYIAETYFEFSQALLESERPSGMSGSELAAYELVIEEEAYPFEERAIEIHEANFELLASGVHNSWIQNSLDKLAELMPGRYAKAEISTGFVGSINSYAYREPNAPAIALDPETSIGAVLESEPTTPVTAENQTSVRLEHD